MSLPVNSLYSLTWGDYGTSLVSAVQLLRCHGDLVDVTLAAGGRSFQAHKIVLCAASPYLLELLKNTTCKHPIVMLAGVNANDLEALLEFVYRGEVSVDHSQLPSLLQAAHCLNIQGLAPQTVTHKDDTAYTSIQIHPSLIQQDVKTHIMDVDNMDNGQQEFITTIQAPTQQVVQGHVVEEIISDQLTEDVTKDVINQFLPQRKRKQRAKKSPSAKVIKMEQPASSAVTTTTTASPMATTSQQSQQQIQIQQQQQQQVVQQVQVQQQQQSQQVQVQEMEHVQEIVEGEEIIEDGETYTLIKTESKTPQSTTQSGQQAQPGQTTPVSAKSDKPAKPKAKSQSEQPATCPICSAVIRQSRNLRRHLELRHFKKRTPKKEPGVQQGETQHVLTEANAGQQNNTITVTMAPNSETQTITVNGQQQQQHVLTQHENPDGTTSLQITQVGGPGGLGPHQIISSLNNATLIRADDGQPIEANLITTDGIRPHTELFRVGTTVYTIEERRPEQPRLN